jgi:hypothetical protein
MCLGRTLIEIIFFVYLMTLPVNQTVLESVGNLNVSPRRLSKYSLLFIVPVSVRQCGGSLSSKLKTYRDAIVTKSEIVSRRFTGGTEETQKVTQSNQSIFGPKLEADTSRRNISFISEFLPTVTLNKTIKKLHGNGLLKIIKKVKLSLCLTN